MPYANAKSMTRAWLAETFPTARVATRIPSNLMDLFSGEGAVNAVIVVGRIGGSIRDYVLDDASIDITCFSPGDGSTTLETAVDDVAEEVRAALLWQFNNAQVSGGVVRGVTETSAPKQIPYDNTNVRRSEASYRITVRSVPTEGVPA